VGRRQEVVEGHAGITAQEVNLDDMHWRGQQGAALFQVLFPALPAPLIDG
jgi:hypothetical protein